MNDLLCYCYEVKKKPWEIQTLFKRRKKFKIILIKIKMNRIITILVILGAAALNTEAFLFGASESWNDLKVTWGINPFGSNNFVSMPRTEQEALTKGWTREKNCSVVNGNRYILKGDRAVMLIFSKSGLIAGIASAIPKGLPFNFPSAAQQQYFNDEGDIILLAVKYIYILNELCLL